MGQSADNSNISVRGIQQREIDLDRLARALLLVLRDIDDERDTPGGETPPPTKEPSS